MKSFVFQEEERGKNFWKNKEQVVQFLANDLSFGFCSFYVKIVLQLTVNQQKQH